MFFYQRFCVPCVFLLPASQQLGRCESCLIDFMACRDLVDRFRMDHPGKEMWMWLWLDSSPSFHARYYLDRVLARKADNASV